MNRRFFRCARPVARLRGTVLMRVVVVTGLLLPASSVMADALADMLGRWRDSDGTSDIDLFRCGTSLCGRIVWLRDEKQDTANPDPALRSRSLIGVRVLTGFSPRKSPAVLEGEGYNPEDGKTYRTSLALRSGSTLVIRGCVLGGLLCDEDSWTRQP